MDTDNVDVASALAYSGTVTMIGTGATWAGRILGGPVFGAAVGALTGAVASGAAAGGLAALSAYEDGRTGEVLDAFTTSAREGFTVGLFGGAVGGLLAGSAAHGALITALSTAEPHYQHGLDISAGQQHHDGHIPTITIGANPLSADWFGCPDGRPALFTAALPEFPENMARIQCPWMKGGHYPPAHYIHAVTEKLHAADMSAFLVNWWECCGDGLRAERKFAPTLPPSVDSPTRAGEMPTAAGELPTGAGEMFDGYTQSRQSLEKAVASWYQADGQVVEAVRLQATYQDEVQAGINTLCEHISTRAGLLPKAPVNSKDQDCLSYLDNAITTGTDMIDAARAKATANAERIQDQRVPKPKPPQASHEPESLATPWAKQQPPTSTQPPPPTQPPSALPLGIENQLASP